MAAHFPPLVPMLTGSQAPAWEPIYRGSASSEKEEAEPLDQEEAEPPDLRYQALPGNE